ncbi:Hypothetical protein CINCED_3A021882 [Cinara cedri]|uniref:Uncharacterized protein n=1 Tax=Cinara cedri TaxID=506608 RepID=A0A5E4MJB3_9HEMI|nr:Hypothetical protein CINCED_3A021882 [Cinara cedri]
MTTVLQKRIITENVNLKKKIKALITENDSLKAKIVELEGELGLNSKFISTTIIRCESQKDKMEANEMVKYLIASVCVYGRSGYFKEGNCESKDGATRNKPVEVKETIDHFKDYFGLERSNSEQILKTYVFDDKTDHTYLRGNQNFTSLVMKMKVDPHLLKDYMETLRLSASEKAQKFVNDVIQSNDDFKDYLADYNTEVVMKDINVLQIGKGEFIGVKNEIVNGEIKNASYYKQVREEQNDENSPTKIVNDAARSIYIKNWKISISKGEDLNAYVNVHVRRPLFTSLATEGQNYDTYGEILLYEVARRGSLYLVKFLVEEVHTEINT